ncbi:BTB/POZ domain-containing protein 9-like isoform X1 [Anopheles merus]|uniref:BTB/POZ domain-containing protein 9-like isoform X1 n=1 Tax=Anopheles merus TaxID=30066 RepID=UPI001BE47C51|nr:BTB/POZ domain-containing protein 9-like isoform X1 [Anopheles merus]
MISTSMIDHSDQVLVCLGELCTSVDYSDVTFLVQNEQIPAHRAILAARSEYFRALLYGGLKESNQSKITLDVSSTAFKQLLRYIYTGSLELQDMEVDDILTLLGLVHQYGITAFVKAISDYLYGVLTVANVCTIADEARLLDLAELADKCYEFIDGNACSVIKHDSLSNLSFDTLVMVLGRERFKHIEEIEIFQAVHKWCNNNDVAEEKKTYLYGRVRYTAISRNNLLQIVRPTGVVNTEHLLNIISIQDGIGLHPYQPPPGKINSIQHYCQSLSQPSVPCADPTGRKKNRVQRQWNSSLLEVIGPWFSKPETSGKKVKLPVSFPLV